MSVFLSAAAREQLDFAQTQLDRHVAPSADGRCAVCGEEDPCALRRVALRVFGRYGCLPRRWPGASRPEQLSAPKAWSGWLQATTGVDDPTV
ncbi:hypothetical protein [Actinoplanes teichomyceticus]|uniref:hypothetical protein n=1 Tax=Actinoplanes teichomyceticus TaxID=1867 RepID=UPI000F0A9744|nr:hypothetical protein [Actinoplanes teichomyceticus]GIF15277.1 hypothetical protein Ate01nite_53090 [Actinoplanes teichomyceticus]